MMSGTYIVDAHYRNDVFADADPVAAILDAPSLRNEFGDNPRTLAVDATVRAVVRISYKPFAGRSF
jgi:hypothetical protein